MTLSIEDVLLKCIDDISQTSVERSKLDSRSRFETREETIVRVMPDILSDLRGVKQLRDIVTQAAAQNQQPQVSLASASKRVSNVLKVAPLHNPPPPRS